MNKIIAVTIFLSLLVACRQVDEFTGNRPIVDTRGGATPRLMKLILTTAMSLLTMSRPVVK